MVFKVVAVKAPLKAIVPTVLVKVTVVAPTVPLKVVPPECVIVRVPMSDTEEPLISAPATPPVAKVKLKPAPVTAPIVKSATSVVALVLIELAPPNVIAPKLMAALVLFSVPFRVLEVGTVAIKPPAKVKVSLPLPKYSAPEVPKVVAFVMLVALP